MFLNGLLLRKLTDFEYLNLKKLSMLLTFQKHYKKFFLSFPCSESITCKYVKEVNERRR